MKVLQSLKLAFLTVAIVLPTNLIAGWGSGAPGWGPPGFAPPPPPPGHVWMDLLLDILPFV